jgi:hypothetical protein
MALSAGNRSRWWQSLLPAGATLDVEAVAFSPRA